MKKLNLSAIEKLTKKQMKKIGGGESHITSCQVTCDDGAQHYTSNCDQDDANAICDIYDNDDVVSCQCFYEN